MYAMYSEYSGISFKNVAYYLIFDVHETLMGCTHSRIMSVY